MFAVLSVFLSTLVFGAECDNFTGREAEVRDAAPALDAFTNIRFARALKKLIDEGTLPRPRRDIRFWWLDEISASQQYFADNPAEAKQLLANINQDMVGARQSAGSRVQFVTRPPFSTARFCSFQISTAAILSP